MQRNNKRKKSVYRFVFEICSFKILFGVYEQKTEELQAQIQDYEVKLQNYNQNVDEVRIQLDKISTERAQLLVSTSSYQKELESIRHEKNAIIDERDGKIPYRIFLKFKVKLKNDIRKKVKVPRIAVLMKECLYLQQQELNNQQNQAHQLISSKSQSGSKSSISALFGTMPCWYYDKKELKDTPSILEGITFETERRYRKEGARFIMSCGTEMGLGHNTIATGVVYFHRFYMFHSFKSFPRYVTACCCLFLAGKVEETPKKCRDIIKTARSRLTDTQFYSFGDDPKEEVMTLERILLQTIKFDLQVEHPYTFLLKYAKSFKGDQQKLQKMVQMAWNFVNDSLSTVVCLQWEPEIIAVALIHLASKLSKFTVADWIGRQQHHLRWWDMFVSDVTMEILEDICHQVLDLYQTQQQQQQSESHSPPQKPPSRADSPTPLKTQTPSVPVTTETPAVKPIKPPAVTTTIATIAPVVSAPPPTELNNIQSIKSLGTAPPSTAVQETLSAASVAAAAAAYHLYAPHQIHPMYSSTPAPPPPHAPNYGVVTGGAPAAVMGGPTVTAPPPLPPPPMAPYAAAWAPSAMPSSHYGAGVPTIQPGVAGGVSGAMAPSGRAPPPPPPGSAGGYYQPPPYGRQTRY